EFSYKATKTLDEIKVIDDEIRKSQIATENATKQVNDSISHLLQETPSLICLLNTQRATIK
ncbi:MAG TPA: hypothetical protein VE862_09390, partial [Candidatus Acidoferrum sp.]|nr:hypothetical protein [Candidatus Acidoferrum sp.]